MYRRIAKRPVVESKSLRWAAWPLQQSIRRLLALLAVSLLLGSAAAHAQPAPVPPGPAPAAVPSPAAVAANPSVAPSPAAVPSPSVAPSVPARPLRVGLSAKSTPCTFFPEGHWQGSFYESWQEVAATANLPFEIVHIPTFRQLLEAGQSGQVDVAVGCINMTPERLAKYRFSVPIEEDGISVVLRREQTQTWLTILRTIGSPGILGLLAVILSFVLFVTLILWRIEGYGRQESTNTTGRPRTFAKLYQILLTGPGTNTIASTVRGNSLISFVYFVRIVAASVLVSLVSVNVIKRSTEEVASRVNGVQDLAGKTVSVGQGSVSEHWIEGWNAQLGPGEQARRIQLQPLDSLAKAMDSLLAGQVDAVIADNAQVAYYRTKLNPRAPLQVAIRNIHRQSQGLILSPQLPEATALRINQAIARIKETGTADAIMRRYVPEE
ncbi:MAG TPA: transporter substrate-binding domain-containing protein [Pseudomonadota bacterium]|nr:transporter substrate-binding domain-containing protein [Pseudomonadota bacterium]